MDNSDWDWCRAAAIGQCAKMGVTDLNDIEDAISVASVKMVQVAEEYDATHKASFHTFAATCIRNRLRDWFRDVTAQRQRERPLHEAGVV